MARFERSLMIAASAGTVLYLLASVVAYVRGGVSDQIFVVLLATAGLALFFLAVARAAWQAINAPGAPGVTPRPKWFWSLLFGRLPSVLGEEIQSSENVRVLLVRGPSHRELEDSLVTRYSDDHLDIEGFDVHAGESARDDFLKALNAADAVYLVWSREVRLQKWAMRALREWSSVHSHIPILAINCLPDEPYQLVYNSIPEARAITGLWRLLVRSSERGLLWQEQAQRTRKFAILAATLAVVLSLGATVLFVGVSDGSFRLAQPARDEHAVRVRSDGALVSILTSEMGEFRERIGNLLVENPGSGPEIKEAIHLLLNAAATFVQEKIQRVAAGVEISSVTFWSPIGLTDGPDVCVCEIGWSEGENLTCFESDRSSVAGCSSVEGTDALWLKSDSGQVSVFGGSEASCNWAPGSGPPSSESMKGLLCMAEKKSREGRMVSSSVCIEMVWGDGARVGRETMILLREQPEVAMAMALIYSVPEAMLAREETLASCERRFEDVHQKIRHM